MPASRVSHRHLPVVVSLVHALGWEAAVHEKDSAEGAFDADVFHYRHHFLVGHQDFPDRRHVRFPDSSVEPLDES